MKQPLFLAFALLLALPLGAGASAPTIVLPGGTRWITVTSGPMAGVDMATLVGNPEKPGPYIVRLKVKDGTKFGPHYHGGAENVTVIAGTLMIGLGDTMGKMSPLPTGGFVSIPARLHHYAQAKGDTVIEIAGTGPMTMTMVGAAMK